MDRLTALALQQYEDSLCDGCGQVLRESMDGDLLDEWTTAEPYRCGACTAIARAAEQADKVGREHPGALRFIVGLREGWEGRLAAARAKRAASSQPHNHEHPDDKPDTGPAVAAGHSPGDDH